MYYGIIMCNCIGSGTPTTDHLKKWSTNSKFCTDWYNIAVELVGMQTADIIKCESFGGGSHECLQAMLNLWYKSPTDHSWQVIIDALEEMKERRVIESIEDKCLQW